MAVQWRDLAFANHHDLFCIRPVMAGICKASIAEGKQSEPAGSEVAGVEVRYIPAKLTLPNLIRFMPLLAPDVGSPGRKRRQRKMIRLEKVDRFGDEQIDLGSLQIVLP